MKHVTRFLTAAALAASFILTGCAGGPPQFFQDVGTVTGALTGATVPGYTVVAAAESFDGLELVAATYLGLPRCTPTGNPICRVPSATPIIKGASKSGRIARGELEVQVRSACAADFAAARQCTAGIPVASYNTLVAATKTIDDATAAYRAATGK